MIARLERKIVLVTGGLAGIGAAIARRMLDEGARVVAGDISARETKLNGGEPASLCLDVQDPISVTNTVGAIVNCFGRFGLRREFGSHRLRSSFPGDVDRDLRSDPGRESARNLHCGSGRSKRDAGVLLHKLDFEWAIKDANNVQTCFTNPFAVIALEC